VIIFHTYFFEEDLCLNVMPRKKLCYVSEEFNVLTFTFLIVGQTENCVKLDERSDAAGREVLTRKWTQKFNIFIYFYTLFHAVMKYLSYTFHNEQFLIISF